MPPLVAVPPQPLWQPASHQIRGALVRRLQIGTRMLPPRAGPLGDGSRELGLCGAAAPVTPSPAKTCSAPKPCSPVTAPAGRRNPVFARTLALSADGVRLLAAGGAPSGALGAPPGGAPAGTAPSRAYIFRLQSCGTRAQAADPVGA